MIVNWKTIWVFLFANQNKDQGYWKTYHLYSGKSLQQQLKLINLIYHISVLSARWSLVKDDISLSDLGLLVFMQTCQLKLSVATFMKRSKCLLPQMFLTLILQQFSITLSEESELSIPIHGTDSYLRFTGLSKNPKIPGKCLKSLKVNKISLLWYFILICL